jgi:adenylate cyclase
MSATPDSTFTSPEQRIADLERQLAECQAERDQGLQRETATAEVLQLINSSPDDLAPVFEAILEKAHTLCGAAYGVLLVRDGEEFRLAAAHGEPRFVEAARQVNPRRPPEGSPLARLVSGERIIHMSDARADDFYRNAPAPIRHIVDTNDIRTLLVVPLRKDGAVLGVITAFRQEVRPFTDKQIALLESFAAQVVIAMENARLLTATREALDQQTATAEVLQLINSSPGDLKPVFDAILAKAQTLCDAAYGSLGLYDGERIRAVAVNSVSEAFAERLQEGFSVVGSAAERLLHGAPFVHIPDMAEIDHPLPRMAVELAGARTALAVPLRKDNLLLGVIRAVRREVRPFTDKQIALLQNFAAQAVIAMENARLLTETREALEQQTATAEVLQVINSSPGDLAPVFDVILGKAHNLCGEAYGSLQLYDGEQFRAVAVHSLSEALTERLRRGYSPGPNMPSQRLLGGAPFVQIADVAQSDDPQAHLGFELGGFRTILWVPLRKDDILLGQIVTGHKEVRPFTDKQIALLQNFASQAVIAMENARLLGELRQRTDEVAELNRGLEARVAEQVDELGRVGRLKRFLAPQLAELIVSQGDEKILESHRREIVVVFCDLRGYTAFTETAEPEEVLDFLREYHGALGPLVSQYEGTLDQFSGDGIMVFFNDPVPCPDPAERAVKMAMAMREEAGKLIAIWRRDGCELGFGAGIAQGYATLGQIGFSERSGYTAIGTVCNLAARLCAEAKDGQILISSRVARAVEAVARLEDLGNLELRGLRRPVAAFNVVHSTSAADAPPNLTVVARGPGA